MTELKNTELKNAELKNTELKNTELKNTEFTLIIIKPDGVHKGLSLYELIKGTDFTIITYKRLVASLSQSQMHYAEHAGKSFFDRITNGLTRGEIIVAIIHGTNAIKKMREIIGSVDKPDTIRGKYHTSGVLHENGVHGSDSVESANKEIKLWFPEIRD